MKRKKLIALLVATTLAMSSMTVSAEELQGKVNYVDTTVYKVQLPTTAGMSFSLDPQGLMSLEDGGPYSKANAGEIVSDGKMSAVNMSSVAVDLYADFYVVDSHTDISEQVLLKNAITEDAQDDNKQKLREIVLNITPTVTGNVTLNNKAIQPSTVINVSRSVAQSPITNGTDKFTMGAATYTYGGTQSTGYTYDMTDGTETAVDLTISGKVAKDFDWSEYTGANAETITLNAVFKFCQAGNTTEVVATPAVIDGACLLNNQVIWIGPDKNNTTATFVDSSSVSDFKVNGVACNYTAKDGYLCVNWSQLTAAGQDNVTTWTFTFNADGKAYTATYSTN